jgi:catechol 2,3-dioxygenase-like lactoylglutathione lyase family enzyme
MTRAKTYGLTHLAIAVRDLNRTLNFYKHVFDMKVMYHEEDFLQLTTPGAHDVLVFLEKKGNNIGKTGGIAHFGFRLRDPKDIKEITKKVIAAGGTITDQGEFAPGMPKLFFKDPDGYEVEVWYE